MIPLQRPDDLQLALIRSPYLPLDVHVLKAHTIILSDVAITFRIIGESHWITVEHAGTAVHEVLACVALPHAVPAFVHRFDTVDSCTFSNRGYSVQLSLEPLTTEIVARGQTHQHIEVVFPHPYGHETLPFTRIWWAVAHDTIRWWTSHVYPLEAETAVVMTKSCYNVGRAMNVEQESLLRLRNPAVQKVEG